MREIQFDGIVGPTHNYGALSPGNLASAAHGGEPSNPRAAALCGVNAKHTRAVATSIAMATVATGGLFFAMTTSFVPPSGSSYLIFAFESVIIGGLGNLWGTLIGGIVLGVSQGLGNQFNPADGILFGNIVFLMILAFRPQGLLAGAGAPT